MKVYDNLNDRMSTIRPELQFFVRAMETRLCRQDEEKGESWKTCEESLLIDKLKETFEEYRWGVFRNRKGLVDIANTCFFLWYRDLDKELDRCSFFSEAGPSR